MSPISKIHGIPANALFRLEIECTRDDVLGKDRAYEVV
jgi:hypothetical protein